VRYRRSLFPGYSDAAEYAFGCPGTPAGPTPARDVTVPAPPRGKLDILATLHYRKLDQYLVDFLFPGKGLSAPITDLAQARTTVEIVD